MFCPKCGTQHEDGARFCRSCGNQFANAAPAAPVAQAPVTPAPKPPKPLKSNSDLTSIILLPLAAITFILAILNMFGLTSAYITRTYNSESSITSALSSYIIESGDFPILAIGNILFGLIALAVAAVGVFALLRDCKVSFAANLLSKIKFSPALMMGVAGAAACITQIFFYLIAGNADSGVRYSIGVGWSTWIMLAVYGSLVALDLFVPGKKD